MKSMLSLLVGISAVAWCQVGNIPPGICEFISTKPPALSPDQMISHGPLSGSLVVAGGSLVNKRVYDTFYELAGGAQARIVYIPTNSGINYSSPEQIQREMEGVAERSGWPIDQMKFLHTYDINLANTTAFAELLTDATGVWMSGGRQWRGVDAYGHYLDPTVTLTAIRGVLSRGGVFGGSSAGAAIQGDFLMRGDTATIRLTMGDHLYGFGLVENIGFDPHLNARRRHEDFVEVVKALNILGIGLDEDTAVVLRGDLMEVVGTKYAVVTDNTIWDDELYCSYYLTAGLGRPRLSNGGKTFFLEEGDTYNVRTREVVSTRQINVEEEVLF